MSTLIPILIQVISGAAGGNVVGKILKNVDMGALWNTVSGALGGGLGGLILKLLGFGAAAAGGAGAEAGGLDLEAILGGAGAGAGGGGVLMAIIGFIKNMMAKGGPDV